MMDDPVTPPAAPDMARVNVSRLGTACLIVAVAGSAMASCASAGSVQVDCAAVAGTALPDGFAADFCAVLREEIALNRPAAAPAVRVEVALVSGGEFSVTAKVTVRTATGAERNQEFALSVHDSSLKPSIAKTLVYSVLKLVE